MTLQDRMGSGCVILHDGKRRLDVPERKLGSIAYNLLKNAVYCGCNPLFLTFDPNFQGDILAWRLVDPGEWVVF